LATPENTFAIIGIIFGLLFLLITPPFQAPDEYNHFYRSFQIAEGQLVAERQQNTIGGPLPRSLVVTSVGVSKDIPFHPENKQSLKDVLSLLNLPLQSQDRAFVSFPNTSLYSPIPYLPQAFGIAVGKAIGFSPIVLMYTGRIANLLVWVLLGWLSIKATPVLKWLFFLLALAPMSLFQAASLSADATTNGVSILLICIILKYGLEDNKTVNTLNLCIIFFLSLMLSVSKQAYFPITLLFLLIPVQKLGTKKRYFTSFALLLLLNTVGILVWSSLVKDLYVVLQPQVSPKEQLMFIASQPLNLLKVIIDTFLQNGAIYTNQFIGNLGWLDTPLPPFFIGSYVTVLVLVSMVSNQKDIEISYLQKFIVFTTFILNGILVCILLYLSWTPIGGDTVEGIQGRYFIPIAPLFFLLFYNRKLTLDMKNFGLVLACYSLFSETITISLLMHRYYP